METSPSVLLVSTSPEALEPVAAELAVAGLRSRWVASPEEAVAQAGGRGFEAAVITAELPGGGAALVECLKRARPGMACLVVAGHGGREEALHCLVAGALAYMKQPLDAPTLVELIRERRRHTLSATEDALSVTVADEDGAPVLQLAGDLDMMTAPLLQRRVDELLGAGHGCLTIDALGVDFCDSTGLRILLGARRRLTERGGALRLRRLSDVLRSLLALSGLEGLLRPEEAR